MPNSNRPQKIGVIKPVLDIINAKMTEKGLIDGMNTIINAQKNSDPKDTGSKIIEAQTDSKSADPKISGPSQNSKSNPKVQDYLFQCELAKQELLRNKDDYGWGDQEVKIVDNFFQSFAQKLMP